MNTKTHKPDVELAGIVLAYLTVSSHDEPLPGSHLRFAETE